MKYNKEKKEHKINIDATGLWRLVEVVAECVASYVLWFSGQSIALKVVAGILVFGAGLRATKAFVITK